MRKYAEDISSDRARKHQHFNNNEHTQHSSLGFQILFPSKKRKIIFREMADSGTEGEKFTRKIWNCYKKSKIWNFYHKPKICLKKWWETYQKSLNVSLNGLLLATLDITGVLILIVGTPLAVQWLRLRRGSSSVPGWGIKIPASLTAQ